MWTNSQETADLVTFSEKMLNGKLHFLCSTAYIKHHAYSCENPTVFRLKKAQLTFTCSNSTIYTQEKGMKYVQS